MKNLRLNKISMHKQQCCVSLSQFAYSVIIKFWKFVSDLPPFLFSIKVMIQLTIWITYFGKFTDVTHSWWNWLTTFCRILSVVAGLFQVLFEVAVDCKGRCHTALNKFIKGLNSCLPLQARQVNLSALCDMKNETLLNRTNEGKKGRSTKSNKANRCECFVIVEGLKLLQKLVHKNTVILTLASLTWVSFLWQVALWKR